MAWFLAITILSSYALQLQAQSIFINFMPGYDQLASCAEEPLSTIVRDMSSGCGDNKQTTSYHCFCTTSSSKMSSIISREVAKTCSGNASDASSALEVFSAYCHIGAEATPTMSGNLTGFLTSPTPANTATSMVTSTTVPTGASSTSSSSNNGVSTSSKIVIGVVVPVSLIIIVGGIAAAILVIRSHRRRASAATTEAGEEPKTLSEDTSTDRGSARSLSTTKFNTAAVEMESPKVEKAKVTLPAELPTDGRYGNGTTAHELQE